MLSNDSIVLIVFLKLMNQILKNELMLKNENEEELDDHPVFSHETQQVSLYSAEDNPQILERWSCADEASPGQNFLERIFPGFLFRILV